MTKISINEELKFILYFTFHNFLFLLYSFIYIISLIGAPLLVKAYGVFLNMTYIGQHLHCLQMVNSVIHSVLKDFYMQPFIVSSHCNKWSLKEMIIAISHHWKKWSLQYVIITTRDQCNKSSMPKVIIASTNH